MSLICPKCGSRNTRVFTAESLFRMTGSASFIKSTSGYLGIGVVIQYPASRPCSRGSNRG